MPEVPLPPRPPLPAAHPAQLAAHARLMGRRVPELDGARYQDRAATAASVLPLASTLPGVQVQAVPASPLEADALVAGREALGLTNLLILDAPEGVHDLVVWHQGFAALPDAHRALASVADALREDGLALLGWSVLPGWHMLGMARDLLRFHTARTPHQAPADAARDLLELLADSMPPSGAGAWLRAVREAVASQDDAELVRTWLAPAHHPLDAHALHALADRAGLDVLGDAARGDASASRLPDHVVDFLVEEQRRFGPLVAEQHVDYLVHRAYRLTVLGRTGRPEAPLPLAGLHVGASGPLAPEGDHPALAALRDAWPASVPYEDLPLGQGPQARLQAVLGALETDAVQLRTSPTRAGGARVPAFVRHLARGTGPVTDLLHAAPPLAPEDRALLAAGHVPAPHRRRLGRWLTDDPEVP